MNSMKELQESFEIKVSPDKLSAEIWYNGNNDVKNSKKWTKEALISFLQSHKVLYGLIDDSIQKVVQQAEEVMFPVIVANGLSPENGKDGMIEYSYDWNTQVDHSEGFNFREVMRIPTVAEGEKIAVIVPPSEGRDGRTVQDTIIKAKPGKKAKMKTGKNVEFDEETQTFIAAAEGQVSVTNKVIHVHDVYEVNESLSLKVGNIDFLGTVIIRGDVPAGFSIKTTGDIKVYGLVEGAELIADGSVYIAEGFAAKRQGFIKAKGNIYTRYINQGKVTAGNIYADYSILHSECTAVSSISCKEGNIIGGVLSAGESVTAKDIGNRMHTITELSLGIDKERYNRQAFLQKEKETEEDNLRKLILLQKKLSVDVNPDAKTRITVLKVRNSINKTTAEISKIMEELVSLDSGLGAIELTFVSVAGTIYPNTIVSFGKYSRKINSPFDKVTVKIKNNEIMII